jgi:release factor glutamine methyltransferase
MKKRSFAKKIVSKFLVPATRNYLKKNRQANFMGLDLQIPAGVFHPSLFFSTKTMCHFLSTLPLEGKKIMEMGCGSGAISIFAAKKNARVFCCDINPLAVKTTLLNAEKNNVSLLVVESDLFNNISEKNFDLILNNPPFYPKDPENMVEHAWYAGKDMEFFKNFFQQSLNHLHPEGAIYMVLSNECDLQRIDQIASNYSFTGKMLNQRSHLLEKSLIRSYTIHR